MPDIASSLDGHDRYWAHIHPSKKEELLAAHTVLVNRYAEKLVRAHHLDAVIDSLITAHVAGWEDAAQCAVIIKQCFVGAIVFHDFGKINENFQLLRMQNFNGFTENKNILLKPSYGHSKLGAFLYSCYYIDSIFKLSVSDSSKYLLAAHCFLLSYSINQHHSPALFSITESNGYLSDFKGMFESLRCYIQQYNWSLDEKNVIKVLDDMEKVWLGNRWSRAYKPFPFYTLIKLNFSLLTAADYLATHHYTASNENGNEGETFDFGVFDKRERVEQIAAHLHSFKHNQAAFSKANSYCFEHPAIRSRDNLNKLREEMAVEVIQTIRAHAGKRLFYLEAPTGGGKTNLSAIIATELLLANPELNKIFYVFPFTTLITQTFGSLKESTGLKDNEIAEWHSKAGLASKTDIKEEARKDGLYADSKKDYIDHLFGLYPVTLLSHVKFFDILKTNSKEVNYLLHRMANSVVIIDELQSYNPNVWDKMLFFISEYAKHFNIRFVLMSATLPKISGLKKGMNNVPDFVDLLPNARKYITNPNFSQRVTFNFELFDLGKIEIDRLADFVLEKSIAYAAKHNGVKTIVEFIYKKSAAKFFQQIQNTGIFHQIFLLSGTVLESRRKEIINYIKRGNSKENILLITTQVVEAGVDIDMDLGFKNVSLIDSDEQLAGRVNRNASKTACEVYLFKMDDAHILYGKDYRYKKTREEIDSEIYQAILTGKDFSQLYEKVIGFIDESNKPLFKGSIMDYTDGLFHFNYPEVDRGFRIIEQESACVFVPLDLHLTIDGAKQSERDTIFSQSELDFLSQFDIYPNLENQISGVAVWSLYERLIERHMEHKKQVRGFDIQQKIDFKRLHSIMSKFTFSLMQFANDYKELQLFGEEKYGYLYLHGWNEKRIEGKPYSYENGLNNEVFMTSNFI
ncbi:MULTISPECIES: CRISPR-associated helicase Cas3' [Niastella]|uniref:CRISPR-associated helicase Cas3 n=1 Tax=Niastella soli TaxID=2821487 RepID=A0ABS3YZG0_9BACT|nr:CRISPR-associated helicase Cas3' [Niastella soli]MBO9203214.1 CRISPR-associated helicase Cas3' [Niastella soli]